MERTRPHGSFTDFKGVGKKTEYVPKLPKEFKLGLVAKRIREKQKLRAEGYLVYDLDDF